MSFTPEQLAEGLAEAERRGDHATAQAFRSRMGAPAAAPAGTMPNLEKWLDKCRSRFKHNRPAGQ